MGTVTDFDKALKEQKDYDHSSEWNEAGWTGKGINIWNMESPDTGHGKTTHRRVLDAAPDANVITISIHGRFSNGEAIEEGVEGYGTAEDFIEAENIDICTASIGGRNTYGSSKFYNRLRDTYNLTMFESAGNEGEKGTSGGPGPFFFIGACNFIKGKPMMAGYSSEGHKLDEVDFSTFAGPGTAGTSFSSPYLAGLTALLFQRYGKMSYEEVYAFYKMIVEPIETGGSWDEVEYYDYKSGWGIPILPHLNQKFLRLTIDNTHYKVDGIEKITDVAPFIKDSRTFVPIAFVALELGANVSWNDKTREVIISKNGNIITMTIDNPEYEVNGIKKTMDTAPFIKNRRTCVPLAFIALELGCKVSWIASKREVFILEGEE